MRLSVAVLALALAASTAPASAATVLNVNWSEGCGKATCFGDNGAYTKTFSAGDFGGPVTIGQLLMQRGVLGSLDGYTFRIAFKVNGEEVGTWGHYNMSGIGGDDLSFAGENFVWNPEDGDLELVLSLPEPPKAGGGGGFFSAPQEFGEGGAGFGSGEPRAEGFGDGEPPAPGPGPVGAVPEPATWAMMIVGFGLAGATLRRRQRVVFGQP